MKSKLFVAALTIFSLSAFTVAAQVPENVTVNDNGLPKANTPSTTTDTKTTPAPSGKIKNKYPRKNGQTQNTQDNKGIPPVAQQPKKTDRTPSQKPEGKEHGEHQHDGDMKNHKENGEMKDHKEGGEKGKGGEMRKPRPEGDAKKGKPEGQGDNKGKGDDMRKKRPEGGEGKIKDKKPKNHEDHDKDHHDKDEKSNN